MSLYGKDDPRTHEAENAEPRFQPSVSDSLNGSKNDTGKPGIVETHGSDDDSLEAAKNAVFDVASFDPVLARKMALANQAIDDIGMTTFQWKMFFLNGFGYAVDSLLIVCHSIANPAVQQEYGNPSAHISGIPLASQVGLLVGAALWGFSADIIGRRLAFNTSLFSCAIFVLIAGAMPGYIAFAAL